MSQRFPLLFVKDRASAEQYTNPTNPRGPQPQQRHRASHGEYIKGKLNEVWNEFEGLNQNRTAAGLTQPAGVYVDFFSSHDFDLALKELESLRKGIRLATVRTIKRKIADKVANQTIATVFIPNGQRGFFLEKIRLYLEEETLLGHPKQRKLVTSIDDIALTLLESFWQDMLASLPGDTAEWCEVWVRQEEENGLPKDRLFAFCEASDIEYLEEEIRFPERRVYLIRANRAQLTDLFQSYEYLAELRRARQPVSFWIGESNVEQGDWARNLLNRLNIQDETNTRILVLDTGVNNGHQLIGPLLSDEDSHSYDPEWGVNDHKGHGTLMSGLGVFGDLHESLQHGNEVVVTHRLESGKILPPTGENEPHLYGDITSQVVSSATIANGEAKRIICLAVTVDDDNQGRPSSWSGALDALAAGYEEEDVKRLIVVAAGNIQDSSLWGNYPATNVSTGIQTPAQAWNVLTVGAYTQKTLIEDHTYAGYTAIAPAMGLSPFSSTSMVWGKTWPQKPDIVMEGGNAGTNGTGFNTSVEDLDILSTSSEITKRQFDVIRATSAATAKAAHLCAVIQSQYPDAWPETIRGLMVHSAEWTDAMKEHFLNGHSKGDYNDLIRCCGYGVPNREKALYCANNLLTLVAQENIQPFIKNPGGSVSSNDVHFFEMPWPGACFRIWAG